MATRRHFIAGLLASGLYPNVSWSDIGNPQFLSAARMPDGTHRMFGLSARGEVLFSIPLPTRGHAGAAHPIHAEAVAFARRPGTYGNVIDCAKGVIISHLKLPEGRHFYGHGCYSQDGNILYTTENEYEAARGVIGIWDRRKNYARIGEFASGGVGPHEMLRLPNSDIFAIANGGIETHPDMGRAKLNIPDMQPNLTYLNAQGEIIDQVVLPEDMQQNSIRHLAVRSDGRVAFAMQWQGAVIDIPPLLGLHSIGQSVTLSPATRADTTALKGYLGSVVFTRDGQHVAASSPRGGRVQFYDAETGARSHNYQSDDICGLGPATDGVFATTGTGAGVFITADGHKRAPHHNLNWDNHIIPI
ncbi:MAG: DUF1513 domain-containing protein [Halocynthiibacter sp.]